MSVAKLNVLEAELDEPLDEAGFRHVATTLGPRLGAWWIGASVYRAEAGVPIWPYHFHYGVEEWLYVVDGAPVLREPSGERALAAGDLVCFPPSPAGAHTLRGPGRFVIFDAGPRRPPYMCVYPDSDKVSGPEGILLRSSAVGYWHGEGTAGAREPEEVRPEPAPAPPRPVVNVPGAPAGAVGAALGAELLEATIVDLEPGGASEPYHYVHGREEWVIVVAGTPTLRHPQGEDRLRPGDVVCFPDGPDGAHQLLERGGSPVRILSLSTTRVPANAYYPDSGEWVLRNGSSEVRLTGRPASG